MTEVDGGWFLFAGGAAIIDGVYCGTVITVPYEIDVKNPRPKGRGFPCVEKYP